MPRKRVQELRVGLFRIDDKCCHNAMPIPEGLLLFVGFALGPKPPIAPLAFLLNNELFEGEVRGYTFVWTRTRKDCFGYTDFTRRIIYLQECLLLPGICRSALVRVLIHELVHAFLDVTGAARRENSDHGPVFRNKVHEINGKLSCDILAEGDIDWARLNMAGLDKFYVCDICNRKVPRTVNRPPDSTFFPWFEKHARKCGGSFTLRNRWQIRPKSIFKLIKGCMLRRSREYWDAVGDVTSLHVILMTPSKLTRISCGITSKSDIN
uniref:CA124_0 protein n=1 Tax=Fopius arisanus TaxID=64838 RepID=A0A0C9RLG2_9HYME